MKSGILADVISGPHASSRRGDRVFVAYWIAAAVVFLLVMCGAHLEKSTATAIATVVFIVGGLPHGAYDYAVLRRTGLLDEFAFRLAVGGYILTALAAVTLWMITPFFALILFLLVAVIHFGEDWQMLSEPMFRRAAGMAVIATPVLFHQLLVTNLFIAMGDSRGALLAQLIAAAAPVALLVTMVGIFIAWREGSRSWAAAMGVCYAMLAISPPVVGFALFFVFLHSPRHLVQTRIMLHDMSLSRWVANGMLLSGAALAGWYVLRLIAPMRLDGGMTVQAFQLLASVSVPHLILTGWLVRRQRIQD